MANTLKFGAGQWATKEGSTLAYNDENDNYKPLPFDFTRASNATVVNKAGLIETVGNGIPRIDYKDDSKGALLLEPQRTNLVYPSDIGTPTSGVGVRNYLAPDGTTSAFYPQPTSTARRFQVIIGGGTYATNTELTYSWYRKRVSTPSDISHIGDLDIKNLINATQVGVTEQIESDVSGFDRFSATFNITDGSLATTLRLYYGNVIGVGNSSVAYWGHQLEEGSYATSYIPTQGSSVTRLADSCSQTVPSGIIGQTEGTLYTEINITKLLGATTRSIVRLGSAVDLVDFSFLGTLNNSIRAVIRTSANTRFQAVFEIQSVGVYKLVIGYKSNDSVFYVNGVQINNTINTSFTMPSIEDITYDYSTELNDSVNQTKLYNTRLSNSELQALTT